MYEYLKWVVATVNNTSTIYVHGWTSKRLSNEQLKHQIHQLTMIKKQF